MIQSAVGIGELGGLLGGHGQIDAAESAEEVFQVALLEEIAGGGPFFLAGEGQFVEAAARPAAGKDEGMRERLAPTATGPPLRE